MAFVKHPDVIKVSREVNAAIEQAGDVIPHAIIEALAHILVLHVDQLRVSLPLAQGAVYCVRLANGDQVQIIPMQNRCQMTAAEVVAALTIPEQHSCGANCLRCRYAKLKQGYADF